MKDITTPVPPEEMKKLVQKCLEKAAQINYSQLVEYAQIKGKYFHLVNLMGRSNQYQLLKVDLLKVPEY